MTNERTRRYNPLNADIMLTDSQGLAINQLGVIDDTWGCRHSDCKKAIREGRPFHLIPPTYADDHAKLSMRVHHFATAQEAHEAYMNARINAITVHTASARDEAYARNVDCWIADDIDLNA